jgi:hypothetical protein
MTLPLQNSQDQNVGFQIFKALVKKSATYKDVMLCSLDYTALHITREYF